LSAAEYWTWRYQYAQPNEALADLYRARTAFPYDHRFRDHPAEFALSLFAQNRLDPQQMRAILADTLARDPKNLAEWFNVMVFDAQMHRPQLAEKVFQRALHLAPYNTTLNYMASNDHRR
jgi:tetratricopeptide (TPR) repeat protein